MFRIYIATATVTAAAAECWPIASWADCCNCYKITICAARYSALKSPFVYLFKSILYGKYLLWCGGTDIPLCQLLPTHG
jgi:hypothetical protein